MQGVSHFPAMRTRFSFSKLVLHVGLLEKAELYGGQRRRAHTPPPPPMHDLSFTNFPSVGVSISTASSVVVKMYPLPQSTVSTLG